jgi:NitT/TauT family transport system substrate-binding protein
MGFEIAHVGESSVSRASGALLRLRHGAMRGRDARDVIAPRDISCTCGVALAIFLLLVSGCSRNDNNSSGPPKVVRLGYFANLTHAQAVLGVSSGEFAASIAPIPFETKVFNAGPSLIEALTSGDIDIGYVGPGPVLAIHGRSKGEAVRVISGAAANGVIIVAAKDSGIQTMKDLVGRRIATPQHGNTQDIAARHYVTRVLGQKDHENVIAVPNAEQATMMQRKDIDAAWVPEPWGARLIADTGARLVAEEKDLWPGKRFSLTVVITTPQFLKAHPDIVEKLLGVHRHWTERLNEDAAAQVPALGAALFKLTGKSLPAGVVREALSRTIFLDDPLPATFEAMGQWSYELGFGQPLSRLDQLFAIPRSEKPNHP